MARLTPVSDALTPRKDVCWKVKDARSAAGSAWYMVTSQPRAPRPMAVYFGPDGLRRYQYRLTRRPRGVAVLPD